MIVERIVKRKVEKVKEGDRISVGKYTATCVKVNGNDCIFLLDQYLDKPFTHKNLLSNLNEYILEDKNFKKINDLVRPQDPYNNGSCILYRVPFAGEMFSGTEEDEWIREHYEPDAKEGFMDIWECMKECKNRIAIREGNLYEWGWLMNKVKGTYSAPAFANVNSSGYANGSNASNSSGVRPVFVINN